MAAPQLLRAPRPHRQPTRLRSPHVAPGVSGCGHRHLPRLGGRGGSALTICLCCVSSRGSGRGWGRSSLGPRTLGPEKVCNFPASVSSQMKQKQGQRCLTGCCERQIQTVDILEECHGCRKQALTAEIINGFTIFNKSGACTEAIEKVSHMLRR